MNTMGNTIKCLRKAMGVTQDEMAQSLGVTIDELFGYKLNVMTNKERLIDFMSKNQILCRGDFVLKNGGRSNYYIDAERFSTNAQISKIGEVFADCIRENNLEFDSIVGLAYGGIGFSAATAISLYNKYGVTTQFCYNRKVPDSKGRMICGHTLQDGERIILVDDVLTTGKGLDKQITELQKQAQIQVAAIIVIMDRSNPTEKLSGAHMLAEKYGAKIYSLITEEDIMAAREKGIITL